MWCVILGLGFGARLGHKSCFVASQLQFFSDSRSLVTATPCSWLTVYQVEVWVLMTQSQNLLCSQQLSGPVSVTAIIPVHIQATITLACSAEAPTRGKERTALGFRPF